MHGAFAKVGYGVAGFCVAMGGLALFAHHPGYAFIDFICAAFNIYVANKHMQGPTA